MNENYDSYFSRPGFAGIACLHAGRGLVSAGVGRFAMSQLLERDHKSKNDAPDHLAFACSAANRARIWSAVTAREGSALSAS